MNPPTLKEKIVDLIGSIGWKLFCWSYQGGEKQYFLDIQEDIMRTEESDRRNYHLMN